MVFEQGQKSFPHLWRYFSFLSNTRNQIFAFVLEPFLKILQIPEFSFSLDEEEVVFVASSKNLFFESYASVNFFCFVEAIHAQLNKTGNTCLMKELKLLCLKYSGRTISQILSMSLRCISVPF